MQVTVDKKDGLERQINITVPAAEVNEFLDARYTAVAKTAKLDGFRAGKVPLDVIKKRHGEQVRAEVAQRLVQAKLPEAIEKESLKPAVQPHVHAHDVKEGEDYSFHAHFEVYPEITPKGYEKIKLTKHVAEVDDTLVEKLMKDFSKQLQDFSPKAEGEAAAEGDKVIIDAVGYVTKDGKEEAFDGGKLDDFAVVIGSNSLIPGFEDGLVGLKTGDKKDIKVTFPEQYHSEDLAGQPAIFKVEVKGIETPSEQKFDDEFAKKLGMDSIDKLKDAVRGGATQDLNRATEQRLKRELYDILDEKNKFEIPQGLVQQEMQGLMNNAMQNMQRQGMNQEQMQTQVESLKTEFQPIAERRVRLGLLLSELAQKVDVKVEKEDIEAMVEQQAQQYGDQAAEVRKYYADPQNRQQLVGPVLEQKVTTWLIDNSDVKEEKVDAEELMKELS